jgi:hypothetical protein
MKTAFFFLLGLFLLAMGATALQSAVHHHGDWIELLIAGAFACGGVAALRKGGKRVDSTKPPTNVGG